LKPKEQYASYIWQDGSTGSSLPVTVPGMYWLEVTDACGSKSRDSITVSEVKFQVALGPDRQICPGESLTLQAPGNFTAVTWGPDYFITSTGLQSVQVNPPTDTVYYVRAEVVPGCYAYDTAKVSVIKTEKVQLPADTAICAGDVLQINAGPGFSSYLWHNQSVQSFISTRDQGLVWVEVKDRNGCTSRDSMVVKWNTCGYGLWLPNSFTPNGDGRNDVFRPIYKGVVTSFRISVYNRWGQVVYYSTDPDKGWDGKLEGQPLDSGTFVWVCSYQMFGGQLIHEKGTLTLIR
jgi:gliding motility-associated-like protein